MLLLKEDIEKVIRKSTSKWDMSPSWKVSLLDRKVDWWETFEEERKKKVDALNDKLKQLLTGEDYEAALQCLAEAREYLEDEDEVIFDPDKYREIQALHEKIARYREKRDIPLCADLMNAQSRLNPFSQAVKEELRHLETYHRLNKELDERGSYQVARDFEEIKKEVGLLPQYLQDNLNERLKKIIRNKIDLLLNQADSREKEGDLSKAILLLREAGNIEYDSSKKYYIRDKISEHEIKLKKKKKLKSTIFKIGLIVLIAAYFIYLIFLDIQDRRNKEDLSRRLREASILVEGNQFDILKQRLIGIFSLRGKLKEKKTFDKDINEILDRVYVKLSRPPLAQENNASEMVKRVNAARKFFEGLQADFVGEWIVKAIQIDKLVRDFDRHKRAYNSGEALKVMGDLKRLYGEVEKPFKLLKLVAYKNPSGNPEVNLRGVRFVFIKGGVFEIGCFDNADRYFLNDAPMKVKILSDFWLSAHEITQGNYNGEPNHNLPQANMTWEEARTFAGDFGKKYGLKSDLPTEAQWEYAARAGRMKVMYPWGNSIDCSKANYRDCGQRVARAVCSYIPNKLGIYDLAGNLREWCRDVYHENAYSLTGVVDPFNSSGEDERVVRGGSFADGPLALKTYIRYSRRESTRDVFTGFRIVITEGEID